jgi:2-hydroxy-6-oxonona-2,4-dienedioate hydrolase
MYPAGIPGLVTRRITIRAGLTLRIVEAGPASGAPVLLVHGWGACVYTYRYLLPALAGAGRRAIAYDLRGHGLSDKPRGEVNYTTAALLGDLVSLLDVLGLDRTDIVGHSLGGGIVLHLALSAPARVQRIVLAAPVGLAPVRLRRVARLLAPRVSDRAARFLTPRWLTSFLLHGAYGNPRRVPDDAVDEYWAPSQFPNYYRALRALLGAFSWDPLGSTDLARIVQPSMVMLGTADRLIPDAQRGAVRLPDSTVLSLDGGGHLAIEECVTEGNAAIIRFLGGEGVVAASTAKS